MSRTFMFGILALLVVLLAVMAHVVGPQAQKPEEAPQAAQKQQVTQQEAMKKQSDERRKMMQKMTEQKKHEMAQAKGHKPAKPAAPQAGTMDISSDWFKKRTDGSQGLASLEAQA